jgi:hypothetical protein
VGVRADAAEGELDRVGLAGDDRKVAPHGRDDRSFLLPFRGHFARRASEGAVAGHAVEILDRDGDALQGSELEPRRESSVGCLRLLAGALRLPRLVGGQRFAAPLMIGDGLLGQLRGRDRLVAEGVGQLGERGSRQGYALRHGRPLRNVIAAALYSPRRAN